MKKLITLLAVSAMIVFGFYACNPTTAPGGDWPTITSQPRDTTVALGAIASFTLTATNALSYQWVKNSTDTVPSGLPILAFLNGVQASDTGAYKCVVGNLSGSTVSNTVHLRIGSLSTGTNPPTITSQPRDTTVALGAIASFTLTATNALSYQWVKNNTDTVPSGLPILAFLGGVQVSDTGTYKCVVSNSTGSVTSRTVHLRISADTSGNSSLPMIITQPHDFTAAVGGTAMFNVVASDTLGSYGYQWKKGGANLSGQTSYTLALSNVSASDTGVYKCVVSNSAGSVTSSTAHLYVGASGNSHGTLEFDMNLLNASSGTSGQLVTRELYYSCDSTASSVDTVINTSFYAVIGGKLFRWIDTAECYADELSGSSATLAGTWTEPIGALTVEIPSPYQPVGCTGGQDNSSGYAYNPFYAGLFQNASLTYTITGTNVHTKFSGDVCNAEQEAESFVDPLNGIAITNEGCSSVYMMDAAHNTALFTGTFGNDSLGLQFKSGNTTCSRSDVIPVPGVALNCSQAQVNTDSVFYACLDRSGFFPASLAKKSAGSSKLAQYQPGKAFSRLWKRY